MSETQLSIFYNKGVWDECDYFPGVIRVRLVCDPQQQEGKQSFPLYRPFARYYANIISFELYLSSK